eukprot:bmy_17371T0
MAPPRMVAVAGAGARSSLQGERGSGRSEGQGTGLADGLDVVRAGRGDLSSRRAEKPSCGRAGAQFGRAAFGGSVTRAVGCQGRPSLWVPQVTMLWGRRGAGLEAAVSGAGRAAMGRCRERRFWEEPGLPCSSGVRGCTGSLASYCNLPQTGTNV